jgi:hypothetical protein
MVPDPHCAIIGKDRAPVSIKAVRGISVNARPIIRSTMLRFRYVFDVY